MPEKIYTIPINEAFDKKCGCPICSLYETLENNELELILGASMMEPDIRVATNRLGFCPDHFKKMLLARKKLPLALMLESHLAELSENLKKGPEAQAKAFSAVSESCYLCTRIENYIENMYLNLFWLFAEDESFREKVRDQKCYCIPHYAKLLTLSKSRLKKPDYKKFAEYLTATEERYLSSLSKDITDFTKMFDYRNADAEWGDFKDAPERIIKTLNSELG